ncbi:MAG: glycine cleavage system protein GcvH [Candidatus Odinarchaeum yellowstonii]|uniref:Probable glycine cleavage system H protein n=1 Tax=Odinarchaeota yellowstonii (strain LCB_4) TaxID=1841599 RepID=A0AAF0D3I7_ODILC|nr:MAG: glycine cleavage system protein GcvH [Candidatus Odinarchaeum yellowstonii]
MLTGDGVLKVGEYIIQEGLYYTKTHEWLKVENNKAIVGITDYAQRNLKDLVYVEFINADEEPLDVGSIVKAGSQIAAIESVKATSEVYSPVSGKILEVNRKLESNPELANKEPYGAGYLMVIEPIDLKADIKKLMDDKKYAEFVKEEAASHE